MGDDSHTFKDEPYVAGYELCNDPRQRHQGGPLLSATSIMETSGDTPGGTQHIVLLGTHDWCHSHAMEETWTATS